jgi:CheY-like chemotaxis protein
MLYHKGGTRATPKAKSPSASRPSRDLERDLHIRRVSRFQCENWGYVMAASADAILVVDDEPSDLEMVRTAIEGLGYEVLAAEDGQGALNLYRQCGKQVVLLVADVAMSPMNGCELALQLAAIQMNLKVLFISGYAGAGVLRREKVADLNAEFLRKPFTAEQLTTQVRALLAAQDVKTVQSGGQ